MLGAPTITNEMQTKPPRRWRDGRPHKKDHICKVDRSQIGCAADATTCLTARKSRQVRGQVIHNTLRLCDAIGDADTAQRVARKREPRVIGK